MQNFVLANISYVYTKHNNLLTLYHIHAQIVVHANCALGQKMYLQIIVTLR